MTCERPPVTVVPVHEEPSDAALLRSTVEGDRDALAALYARHAPCLLLRLRRRCADPSTVDEVLQDTSVAVWRGAGRWEGRGEVAAWIWGIGVRRLVDAVRRRPAAALELRAVVRATVLDGLPTREAAALLGIPTLPRRRPCSSATSP